MAKDPEEITYVCRKCKAEDHDRGTNLPRPIALSCWNCHAGQNLNIQDMIQSGKGMFPER